MLERVFNSPEEYQGLVLQSLLIPRFTRSYKEGIFRDSIGTHLIRGVDRIDRLNISEKDKIIIKRGFWIHDLPEVATSDYTVIQKENSSNLRQNLKERESAFVKKWFTADDQELYWEIEEAGNFFSNKTNSAPPVEALIIKLEDTIEGDLFYHNNLALWCSSAEYNIKHIPSDTSLVYSFRAIELRTEKLQENPEVFAPYIKTFKNELIDELTTITNYWKSVPQNRIPEILKIQLLNAKNQLLQLDSI